MGKNKGRASLNSHRHDLGSDTLGTKTAGWGFVESLLLLWGLLLWREGGDKGLIDAGVDELEAGGLKLGREHPGAREESLIGHGSESQAKGEGGGGEDGRAVQHMGEGASEFSIADRVWGCQVDGASEGGSEEGKNYGPARRNQDRG